ncbi:murein L,D-transpeptidase [Devosia algicola]|uniref:Murein L,D-transpeptidase n=1 Tax=Devosia algicola TaxID=3026418 RepID=A0ABY7YJX7_9HYPH|nr:murein L,D-transpeptidase family protein [Devosia algicola]WDR01405.1 murein L,D-transpeptidase [Devosia algicola]
MNFPLLRKFCSIFILGWIAFSLAACGGFATGDNRHNQPLSSVIQASLRNIGSSPGAPMVIRLFKQEKQVEIWKQSNSGQYRLLKTYDICAFSGDLGPKFKEGDRQSPEGFYTITPGLMNPKSNYYLAFNTGFPNKFDRAWGRTGTDLMMHGDCSSRGCYAMTDGGIAEIYALARETFKGGNHSFQLELFPFRMTAANLAKQSTNPHLAFWKDIKQGYDYFEVTKTPPVWDVCEKRYIFNPSASGPLDAAGACPATKSNPALMAKQAADQIAYVEAVETLQQRQERQAAEAQHEADAQAAAKQRGQAISGFFGNLFGNQSASAATVANMSTAAPAPAPAPKR